MRYSSGLFNGTGLYDNAMERSIQGLTQLAIQNLEGTVYGSALLSSAGVAKVPSGMNTKFRVRKVYQAGVSMPNYDQDWDNNNLLGSDMTPFGPFQKFNTLSDAWPDPDLAVQSRTQALEFGMYSMRLNMPAYHADKIAESDPNLVAEIISRDMQSVADSLALHFANSFYTSDNEFCKYATIGDASMTVQDLDDGPDFSSDFPDNANNADDDCILVVDLASVNPQAIERLEKGMLVDLVYTSTDGGKQIGQLVNVVGSGVRATGVVINVDIALGKIYIAFFAEGAATGGETSISYLKKSIVSLEDFDTDLSGAISRTFHLVPARTTLDQAAATARHRAPMGINSWHRASGLLIPNNAIGSIGDGQIDVDRTSQFKSIHYDNGGNPLTWNLINGIVRRLMPMYRQFGPTEKPDTLFAPPGVIDEYVEQAMATKTIMRDANTTNTSRDGNNGSIGFETTSGFSINITPDRFADSGRAYLTKVAGNWEMLVPPEISGASSSGEVGTPSFLPIRFVAGRTGSWSGNTVPFQPVVNNSTRFVQDSYVPMELKMQLACKEVPVGAVIHNLKESHTYGDSTNWDA